MLLYIVKECTHHDHSLYWASCCADEHTTLQQIAADYTDALKQAAKADAIVACIGEPNYTEKPGDIDSAPLPTGLTNFIGMSA
jgi:hypothetical protein